MPSDFIPSRIIPTVFSTAPSFLLDDFLSRLAKRLALGRIGNQAVKGFLKLLFISDLHRCFVGQEFACNLGKVAHVRAKHDRLGQAGWLNRVLPPCGEAFPDKNCGGCLVKKFQLAGGVDQQTLQTAFLQRLHVVPDLVTEEKPHTQLGQSIAHFATALVVARNQNQEQVGMPFTQALGQAREDFLLTGVCAPAHDHRCLSPGHPVGGASVGHRFGSRE